MKDCIFCKIISGKIPAKFLYQDDRVVAFADRSPQAPTHLLIIPREHIHSMAELDESQGALAGHLLYIAAELARKGGLGSGYRAVINTGEQGGQTVFHLHVHLLGGRTMHWPPG